MIWKDLGFSLIILLAGLKAIPETYYEAALVDGANAWQAFRQITIPLLMPVLMFVAVTQAVFSFQVFVPVYQMTRGGPLDSTKVLVYYIYQQGFKFQDMGYASALSVVALVILVGVSYALMHWLRPQTVETRDRTPYGPGATTSLAPGSDAPAGARTRCCKSGNAAAPKC